MDSLDVFHEQIFFCTLRITVMDEIGSSTGTGFICRVKYAENKTLTLLISNKHVFKESLDKIKLVFHARIDENVPKLGVKKIVNAAEFVDLYIEHPTEDLAAVNISGVGNKYPETFYRFIQEDIIYLQETGGFFAGMECWSVGYPDGKFDIVNNLPILRHGVIASIPRTDFNGRQAFLIDSEVFQGTSGSPVFCAINGKPKLVGILDSVYERSGEIESSDNNISVSSVLTYKEHLSLGIIIKSSKIIELIEICKKSIVKQASHRIISDYQKTNSELIHLLKKS